MANIRLDLDYPLEDGQSLTFKAPCDCTAITGIKVYYPTVTEGSFSTTSKVFTLKDAHGNTLIGLGNLFMTGAYVKVVVDTVNNFAYIQNADTNGYLESKFSNIDVSTPISEHDTSTTAHNDIRQALANHGHEVTDLTGILPVANGGTGVNSLSALATALGAAQTQVVSYVGTEKYGASNPCSVAFNFAPKVVRILTIIRVSDGVSQTGSTQTQDIPMDALTTSYKQYIGFSQTNSNYGAVNTNSYSKKSSDGKTLYWYNTTNSVYQCNSSLYRYYIMAIG